MIIDVIVGSDKDKLWKHIRKVLIGDLKYSIKVISKKNYQLSFDEVIGSMRVSRGNLKYEDILRIIDTPNLKKVIVYSLNRNYHSEYLHAANGRIKEILSISDLIGQGFSWGRTIEQSEWEAIHQTTYENERRLTW